jgi:hypothetical protein
MSVAPTLTEVSTGLPELDALDTSSAPEIRAPSDASFGDLEFINADHLQPLAEWLVERSPELAHIEQFTVEFLWKRKASKSGTTLTAGKCIKTSGPLKTYSGADFVIWLAADVFGATSQHILAAALYHELSHITETIDKDDEIKPSVRSHEWEGFVSEIQRFGLWRGALERVGEAVTQLRFD